MKVREICESSPGASRRCEDKGTGTGRRLVTSLISSEALQELSDTGLFLQRLSSSSSSEATESCDSSPGNQEIENPWSKGMEWQHR